MKEYTIQTIFIDLDAVVADLLTKWLQKYNKDYNDNLTPGDINVWNWSKLTKPECGNKVFDYLNEPGMFADLPLIPGAKETINWIKNEMGIDVKFLSSGFGQYAASEKHQWIDDNFNDIGITRFDSFIGHYKEYLSHVPGSILIDDSPDNVLPWGVRGVLFGDYPYNRNVNAKIKTANWKEVREFILGSRR